MDMWINLWTNYVTPKSQLTARLRIGPQDIVHTSKFVPYTDAIFGPKSLEILDRVRVGLSEFGDPVHKRDHNFIRRKRVFDQIGHRKGLAQIHHVIARSVERDLPCSCGNLRSDVAKAQPCGVRLRVDENLVQGNFLTGGDIGGSERAGEENVGRHCQTM